MILKLLDKTMELVKLKEKNKKEFFDLVIEPLFNEFEKVSKSYFTLYQNNSQSISNLKVIRNDYIQDRIKITALVDGYSKEIADDDVCKFFESIKIFFYGSNYVPGINGNPDHSQGWEILHKHHREIDKGNKLNSELEAQYEKMQSSWRNVVMFYGVLKNKYKLPIGHSV